MIMHRFLNGFFFFCSLHVFYLTSSPVLAQQSAAGISGATDPKITNVKFLQLSDGPKAKLRLAILGENLGTTRAGTEIILDTDDPGQPVENQVVDSVSEKEVDVSGEAPVGTVINTVKLTVGGKTATSHGLSVSVKSLPTVSALRKFEVKLDHQQSKEFPNLHSLLVTRESGDTEVGFDSNPNHMRLEIEPAGATDLSVVQSNQEQLELRFVAAADYEPKNVLITVYDSSDLDRRRPISVAKVAKPAEDTDAPEITRVETLFLDRGAGNGRIRIYGKRFGDQGLPPSSVDEFLCNCLERPRPFGDRTCGILGDDRVPLQFGKRADRTTRDVENDYAAKSYAASGAKGDLKALGNRLEERRRFCERETFSKDWIAWRDKLRKHVIVSVNSKNQDIRVEKVEVIDANDKMLDVYFEFTRYPGYAWPFRLASVDLILNKMITKAEQKVKAEGVYGEVDATAFATFSLSKRIAPEPDPNLKYQYTILDGHAAKSLLGQGIADNFYVLQLSVVNGGKKKITIPLAAIQAEVEWLRGERPKKRLDLVWDTYLEGPPTVAPIPLAAVSAYFGAYQKDKGVRTKVFNILEGVTTLATALVPFTGPALKDAEIVFSGGFIPGLRQAWTDLAAQQLQNLTSLSWESSETLAAGESTAKYIYIQRTSQFQDPPEPITRVPTRTYKQISNIMALEVIGFEVPDTPAKQATPAATSSAVPQETPPIALPPF